MLRINPGNMCKVLGHCDGLISWHRGTAHSQAPQGTGVSEWLLVTNMEKFQVPLHGYEKAVNLPPQVSRKKQKIRTTASGTQPLEESLSLKTSVKITLALPGGDRGGDIQPRMQRNGRAFISRAWEEEGKVGERGKNGDAKKKKKNSEVLPEE